MSDYDAVKATIDILARSDLLDELVAFLEMFEEKNLVPKNLLGFDLYFYGYNKAKKFNKSLIYGEKAIELCEDVQQSLAMKANLSKVYLSANKPLKALECYNYLMEYSDIPDEMLLDYSAALFACNRKAESFEIISKLEEDIWKFDSRTADSILFNKGVHLISQGDFKGGMDHLAVGRKLNVFGTYTKEVNGLSEWNGYIQPGKHLLFVSEGGIGDEIINVRFVKRLASAGMKVSIMSSHKVSAIYDHLPFVKKITPTEFKKSDYDMWTPMMDLPHVMNLDFDDLWDGPYLESKDENHNKFSSIITGNFKVGIRWAGNPRYDHELHRTLSLQGILQALPENRDWNLYSLQRDIGTEQLTSDLPVKDLSGYLETFDDLLGAINNLDLIITSCTSVAHAACAMGKRTIVIIPIMEYYTWAEGKPTSSFYGDNLRLIRQITPETWKEAYDELKFVLKDM